MCTALWREDSGYRSVIFQWMRKRKLFLSHCKLQVKTNKHSRISIYFLLFFSLSLPLSISFSLIPPSVSYVFSLYLDLIARYDLEVFFQIFSQCSLNCIFEVPFLVAGIANSKLHFTNTRITCQKVVVTIESRSFWFEACFRTKQLNQFQHSVYVSVCDVNPMST